MMIISKALFVTATVTILIFSMTGVSYQQVQFFFDEEGVVVVEDEEVEDEVAVEGGPCIGYETAEKTIAINCNASFLDVVQTINNPQILENGGNGEYILNANLEVADGITFAMTSNGNGLQYLKITGA